MGTKQYNIASKSKHWLVFVFGIIILAHLQYCENPLPDNFNPVFKIDSIYNIAFDKARCAVNCEDTGIYAIEKLGICISTNPNPIIDDNISIDLHKKGMFTEALTDLQVNTKYYVRVWYTISTGTYYSEEVSFRTDSILKGTFNDQRDGNTYKWVKLGEQVWMTENLRATTLNDDTEIIYAARDDEWDLPKPAYCWLYNDENKYKSIYGALYNWYVVETEKICPLGWHVPSDEEWKQLEVYLGMDPEVADESGFRGDKIGAKLKDTTGWIGCCATNTSRFNAVPSGWRDYNFNGTHYNKYDCYWWTATKKSNHYSWARVLQYNTSLIARPNRDNRNGYSIRCVRDE